MTTTLNLELGERSYSIHIGPGLLAASALFESAIRGRQVLVVTNDRVGPLYLQTVLDTLGSYDVRSLELPDGEQFKTLETLNLIFDALLKLRFNRNCTLVALGGGVVGDITGFAAACYQRGVDFIQIPTTLLAQVDSSVGGKTGVNHALGKNMIGAFHQPRCVMADTDTLNTLEDRQLSAGIAEIIKYGLIMDAGLFSWLEHNVEALLRRDVAALTYAIKRSCECKADIVAADERETGQRALLNLGHTFGHAIETGTGYGSWLHGEAVAAGIAMAADLSARQGWIDATDVTRVRNLLRRAKLPVDAPPEMTVNKFLDLMAVDKKVSDGGLRLVLLDAIGSAHITSDFDPVRLRETLDARLPRTGS